MQYNNNREYFPHIDHLTEECREEESYQHHLFRLVPEGTLAGKLKCFIVFVQLTLLIFYFSVARSISGYQEGNNSHKHSFREAEAIIQVQVFYNVYLFIPNQNDSLLHITLHSLQPGSQLYDHTI